MTVDNGIRVVTGTFILISLALGLKVNPWSFAFTAFVGVNLVPMDREVVLADYTVIVEGDRIAAVGPAAEVAVPEGATEVRFDYHTPGLAPGAAISAATLLSMLGLLGWWWRRRPRRFASYWSWRGPEADPG